MSRHARFWVGAGTFLIALAGLVFFSSTIVTSSDASGDSILHPVVTFTVTTNAENLPQAFAQAGVPYYPEDHISTMPSPSLGIGSIITVTRALPVTVTDGNTTTVQRTWATTVGGLLTEKNIVLGVNDQISPPLTTTLTPDTTITIIRVARTTEAIDQPIPYQTVDQNDPNLWYGQTAVTQTGQTGVEEIDHLLIRQNGELVSDTITGSEVVSQPTNEIIGHGTKLNIVATYNGAASWYGTGGDDAVAISSSLGIQSGQMVKIINRNTGDGVIATVNDSCPGCSALGRVVDLGPSYFQQLGGTLGQGIMSDVEVEVINNPS